MTDAQAAALNDPIMGEISICHGCATAKGGRAAPFAVTCWIATCIVCNEPKSCCHVRDYGWPGGIRPKKKMLDKPHTTVTATDQG